MRKRTIVLISVVLAIAAVFSFASEPGKRLHQSLSWTNASGKVEHVACSTLTWQQTSPSSEGYLQKTIKLFEAQDGGRWIAENLYNGTSFKVTITLLNSSEKVTVLLTGEGAQAQYQVDGCGVTFIVAGSSLSATQRTPNQKKLLEALSKDFASRLAAVLPWVEHGYLGASGPSCIVAAIGPLDLIRTEPAVEKIAETTPLKPTPVDCGFDAGFGYACGAGEKATDAKGMVYLLPPMP